MTPTPANPTLYEIDARAWLASLGRDAKAPMTLDGAPDAELDLFQELGFDWVWLLGVWRIGKIGREVWLSAPEHVRQSRELLPDFQPEDMAGSVFAVQSYEVAAGFGGESALARFRERLHVRGIRLMLDFVPNHTARDHPWVAAHPEYYIHGADSDLAREPQNYAPAETDHGPSIFAFGRDPYFPGWSDTFQLNYRCPALRQAMAAELSRVAALCDGVRCDMAMLLLPEVFLSTWGDRALPADGSIPDDSSFWPSAISRAQSVNPEITFLAEAYWDMEWPLIQEGFDLTYDKRLYDRLRAGNAPAVRAHLRADLAFQRRCARFLENHDEDRAASTFPPDMHRSAAVISFLSPGLRFFHQGQLEGRKVRPSVHLSRRPDDPVDPSLIDFYGHLLAVLTRPESRQGDWRLVECREGWPGNPTWDRFIAFTWELPGVDRLLVVSNYGPTQGQCFVALSPSSDPHALVRFRDLTGPAVYDRYALDLSLRGLYLDLPAWGFHVFAVETPS